MSAPYINGLVLAGGQSRRMGRDKAALMVAGRPALERAYELLHSVCEETFVSVRPGGDDALRARFPLIEDGHGGVGPADGIASAQRSQPERAWLVVACDLPRLDRVTVETLLAGRAADADATAYQSVHDSLPEPLCAIYEPASVAPIAASLAAGRICPRKMLLSMNTVLLELPDDEALDNMNTPDDWARFTGAGGAR